MILVSREVLEKALERVCSGLKVLDWIGRELTGGTCHKRLPLRVCPLRRVIRQVATRPALGKSKLSLEGQQDV